MKKILTALFFTFMFSLLIFDFSTTASADTYPNTSVQVKPGDILYTTKSKSTFFAGHIGIVGTDLKIKHTLPGAPNSSQTVTSYFNQFDDITLLIPSHANTTQKNAAAKWATDNINSIKTYAFDSNLSTIAYNYCSKFVWQAYNSTSVDIAQEKIYQYVGSRLSIWVTPDQIMNHSMHLKIKLK